VVGFAEGEVFMRIGVMVVMLSLAALTPASLLADPETAGPASEQAASPQAAPAATGTGQAAAPAADAKSTSVAQANAPQNPDEIVCKNAMMITGSRLGATRECHSVSWWNKHEQPAAQQPQADSGH
jgi:hypothetical protein